MLQINENELVMRYRQPGGADWVGFVNNLLWAACWQMGIPESAVRTVLRTEIGDGGVDTRIELGSAKDTTGYLSGPTIWQYKAADESSLTKASVEEEVGKWYATERINAGDAYRLCVCSHIADNKRTEVEAYLKAAVAAINQSAAAPKLLSAADVAHLAGHFPAFVQEFRGFDLQKGTYTLDAWGANATARTHTFVPNEAFLDFRTRISEHLDEAHVVREAVLPLVGNSGIGKTRCLFEALRQIKGARGLLLYVDNETEALGIATMLASTPRAAAILVVDDCSQETRYALNQSLVGHRARVRAITVHHETPTARQATPEVQIEKYESGEIEEILRANYPGLAPERMRAYIELSERYLRLAIDLCEHDAEISGARALEPADLTIAAYYRKRVGDKRDIISALALFTRVGRAGDVSEEFDALCRWRNLNRDATERQLSELKDSPGFVERSAIYYRVSPEIIAMQAFDAGWNNWADGRSEGFLQSIQSLPEAMQKSFLTRVSRSARPEVREIVRDFFRSYGRSFNAGSLGSLDEVLRLKTLIEVEPGFYLQFLKTAVLAATDKELKARAKGGFGWGPRRELVFLADQLAQFSKYFPDAEEILFRLAKAENEPEIGNNATKTWQRMFSPIVSGTPIPVIDRLRLLESRLPMPHEPILNLYRGALESLTRTSGTRSLGSSLFAGLIPEPEWRFSSREEVIEYVNATLRVLILFAESRRMPEDVKAAYDMALNAIVTFVRQGYLENVIHSTSNARIPESFQADLYARFQALLELSSRHRPGGLFGQEGQGYQADVLAWLEAFRPQDFLGKLIVEAKGGRWDHIQDGREWKTKLKELGRDFLKIFETDLPQAALVLSWLHSDDAKAAFDFGFELGEEQPSLALINAACQLAISSRRPDFARGLFAGHSEAHIDQHAFLNSKIDEIEGAHPEIAFHLAQSMGNGANVFERTLRMVNQNQLSPLFLRNLSVWVGTRRTTVDEAQAAVDSLWPLIERGIADAADAAMEFIEFQYEPPGEAVATQPGESFNRLAWRVAEATMEIEGRQSHSWGEIVRKALPYVDADAGAELLAHALVSSNLDIRDISEKLMEQLADRAPESVMNALGRVMLDEHRGWHFRVSRFKIFEILPVDNVARWLDRSGSEGALQIARHLPPPFLTAEGDPKLHPTTELVLTKFGEDARVFSEFCAGVHSWQTYWGDIAAAKEKEAKVAEKFLTYPLPAVQKWADVEISSALQQATLFRGEEDKWRC